MAESILIVDDEETLRLSMKARLEVAGFSTETVENGEEALGKMKSREFDVVLMDIKMPGMGGIEALRLFNELYPNTDVVMLTGFADFSTAIECLKLGAKDYMVKPVDATELVAWLRSLVRSRTSEKALQETRRNFLSMIYIDLLGPLKSTRESLERVLKSSPSKLKAEQQEELASALALCEKMISRIQSMDEEIKQDRSMEYERPSR
ncbi:MAG: response regulator [Bacteroidota bacterium]